MNLATGAPVKDASVDLRGPYTLPIPNPPAIPAPPAGRTQTDSAGHFAFATLKPGIYLIDTTRAGFVSRGGRDAQMVTIIDGRHTEAAPIKLTPMATVTGTVTGEEGQPMQNARVWIFQPIYLPGGKTSTTLAPAATTDDRGVYRLRVPPGSHYSMAAAASVALARNSSGRNYRLTYWGGTPAKATLELAMAETRTVDFNLQKSLVARVHGRLLAPNGLGRGPGVFALTRLQEATPTEVFAGDFTTNLPDGNFEISNLVAGSYRIVAYVSDGAERLVGAKNLEIPGNSDGMTIQLAQAPRVRGKITVEGEAPVDVHDAWVYLTPVEEIPRTAAVPAQTLRNDLTFEAVNLMPIRYFVLVSRLPLNCYVKSVLYGGKEVAAGGFDASAGLPLEIIVSTAGAARLDVAIEGALGNSRTGVSLFPLDGPPMTAQSARKEPQGNFVFEAVRPGKYMVTAWEAMDDVLKLQASGIESLKPLGKWSQILTLTPGDKQSIRLTPVSFADRQQAFAH